MSDRSHAELLEEIESLKRELEHTKQQLEKKSHQASVYSKLMHGAMRHLRDEWFPFKGFGESRPSELAAASELAVLGDVSDDNKLAIRARWNLIQKRIAARVKPK